jgi:hypothetical protein
VATEAVFLMAIINALENRNVAVVDIPGAFMQVNLDDKTIHVRLAGKMVELLLEIDHELYKPYLMQERGEMITYVKLLKALYRTMRAARLFWNGCLGSWSTGVSPRIYMTLVWSTKWWTINN